MCSERVEKGRAYTCIPLIYMYIYKYTQNSGTVYEAFFFQEHSLLILSFTESTVNQCLPRVHYICIYLFFLNTCIHLLYCLFIACKHNAYCTFVEKNVFFVDKILQLKFLLCNLCILYPLYVSCVFSHGISLLILIPGGPASGYSKQQLQAPLRVKTAPTPGSKSYLGQLKL